VFGKLSFSQSFFTISTLFSAIPCLVIHHHLPQTSIKEESTPDNFSLKSNNEYGESHVVESRLLAPFMEIPGTKVKWDATSLRGLYLSAMAGFGHGSTTLLPLFRDSPPLPQAFTSNVV
jgi:hypothetical protein